MGRTVEELDASLSTEELMMWVAYSVAYPWGDDRADWRTAMTNYILVSMLGSGKRQLKVSDFLLQFAKKKSKIRPSDGMDVNKWNALVLQAMFGGKGK